MGRECPQRTRHDTINTTGKKRLSYHSILCIRTIRFRDPCLDSGFCLFPPAAFPFLWWKGTKQKSERIMVLPSSFERPGFPCVFSYYHPQRRFYRRSIFRCTRHSRKVKEDKAALQSRVARAFAIERFTRLRKLGQIKKYLYCCRCRHLSLFFPCSLTHRAFTVASPQIHSHLLPLYRVLLPPAESFPVLPCRTLACTYSTHHSIYSYHTSNP